MTITARKVDSPSSELLDTLYEIHSMNYRTWWACAPAGVPPYPSRSMMDDLASERYLVIAENDDSSLGPTGVVGHLWYDDKGRIVGGMHRWLDATLPTFDDWSIAVVSAEAAVIRDHVGAVWNVSARGTRMLYCLERQTNIPTHPDFSSEEAPMEPPPMPEVL